MYYSLFHSQMYNQCYLKNNFVYPFQILCARPSACLGCMETATKRKDRYCSIGLRQYHIWMLAIYVCTHALLFFHRLWACVTSRVDGHPLESIIVRQRQNVFVSSSIVASGIYLSRSLMILQYKLYKRPKLQL